MRRVTESDKIGMDEIRVLADTRFGDMIKDVVDLERGILLLDADLQADQEVSLLADGSTQANLWGINLYPDVVGDDPCWRGDGRESVLPLAGRRLTGNHGRGRDLEQRRARFRSGPDALQGHELVLASFTFDVTPDG